MSKRNRIVLGAAFALNTGTYVSGPGHQGALLRGGASGSALPRT